MGNIQGLNAPSFPLRTPMYTLSYTLTHLILTRKQHMKQTDRKQLNYTYRSVTKSLMHINTRPIKNSLWRPGQRANALATGYFLGPFRTGQMVCQRLGTMLSLRNTPVVELWTQRLKADALNKSVAALKKSLADKKLAQAKQFNQVEKQGQPGVQKKHRPTRSVCASPDSRVEKQHPAIT